MNFRLLILAVPLCCGGCAALFHGIYETIAVGTDPDGAACTVWRNGVPVATVPATPGAFRIDKMRDPLTIVCTKPDYQTTSIQVGAVDDPAAAADFLTPIGVIFDQVAGSAHLYPNSVMLSMAPDAAIAPPSTGVIRPYQSGTTVRTQIVPQH